MPSVAGQEKYVDVLDMHGAPKSVKDRSFNIFFDAGAWHGYSLPPASDHYRGFIGPFVHSLGEGQWIGSSFAVLSLQDAASHKPFPLPRIEDHAFPGYLVRRFSSAGLQVSETLFFADSGRALVRIDLSSDKDRDIDLRVNNALLTSAHLQVDEANGTIAQSFANSNSKLITKLHIDGDPAVQLATTASSYHFATKHPLHLEANQARTVYLDQVFVYDARSETPPAVDYAQAWQKNRERWSGYLKTVDASRLAGVPDETARRIAVKSILTLLGNWRAAHGDLHHDGVIPSYSNPDFNGFWAWDSWKHAVALARFAPALARDQMRAMFDYQADDGMVPDCIYLDKANNNWRDTKPPLAAWAVHEIHRATDDKAFLAEMYAKLVRYHRWWFAKRDHDHNGLAEYGSTDGTKIAAKWESGMDNGARFDAIAMLRNSDGAWSMDQESADLNAYLYLEKLELAEIANALGKTQEGEQWIREAATMKAAIQKRMFDSSRGYFFDVKLGRNKFVPIYGSEGWTALWAGVATPEQAQVVAHTMLDPKKFSTRFPFPTLAADDPRFSPIKGYWRGPVWIDQAWFGVEALKRYGFDRQADEIAKQLILNAKGLTEQAPMYENYDPLTGEGHQSRNFSWAAASYLFLLHN
ncbi:MGH1-like glycoside hydrolase domain-containing protein [Rudaea sp.]|uniref:MGH1-like glycoside hydrolase domain-containing protein n=1 Tax=Rudaea sp. TaxID=2136325 RepID=UPI002ED54368